MNLFELKNTEVSYGDFKALKGLTFNICEGEKVAVIGPSGAGKSTLLKHLYECLPEKCSVIHQDFALIKQLSVFHNIYMGRLNKFSTFKNIRNFFIPEKEIKEEVSKIAARLEIKDKIDTKISALSGGQQQRVSIGRALYHDAEIILGDEPVSSLDPENARLVLEKLLREEKTVILSLHNVDLALRHADRIIALQNGKVFFDLEPDKVSPEKISRLYAK